MKHEAKVVAVKEVSDEQVAYLVRCCDDPMSESVHTASVTAENHDEELQAHIDRVAAMHEKKQQWRERKK